MAGNDIFGYGRNPKARGVFSQENSLLTFGTDGDDGAHTVGYLVQNWNISYSQTVTEIFEIGSNRLYWAKGRPTGNGAIGRVVGETDAGAAQTNSLFPEGAYDICNGGVQLVITARGGACDGGSNEFGSGQPVPLLSGVRLIMDGCAITNLGYSMQVADVRLMENITWRFAYLEVESSDFAIEDIT